MDNEYNPTEWATRVALGRRVFVYNYALRGDEFRGWELVKTTDVEHEKGLGERVFILKRNRGEDEVIHISVVETSYWAHALEQLKSQLEHCMRPNIAQAKGRTAEIGDVQFEAKAPGSRTVQAVFFARGNLEVTVRSVGDTPVDVVRFAAEMDQSFTRPLGAQRRKVEAAKRLKPATLAVKKRRKTVFLERLPERTRRAGWVRAIAPDGELRREDDTLYYFPDQAGQKRIEIVNLSLQ